MRFVDLERADRPNVQVGKVADYVAVYPVLHLAVIFSRRVAFDHQFVAVPAVSLRHEVRHRLEVWVLRRERQPLALVPCRAG
jgi:hypothetical protein